MSAGIPAGRVTCVAFVVIAGIGTLFAILTRATDQAPPRFAEVIPGAVLRGGYPQPEQLRWLTQRYGVRSVVSLMRDEAHSPRTIDEHRTVRELGLRFAEFPMPGDGLADFDALDGAADAVDAGEEFGPVYLHCAAGQQRSNAATAAYRMRHCGWTLDQALAELEQRFGLDRTRNARLVTHLTRYWNERVAPTRQAASSAGAGPR